MHFYCMEVKYVEIILPGGVGVIKKYDYTPYSWIPNEGNVMRLDSGKYNGLYKVTTVEYNEATQTVKIWIKEY